MHINLTRLQENISLRCLVPGFINNELCHLIASDENTFRFANWNDLPAANEKKLYCLLNEQPPAIPSAENTFLTTYAVYEDPPYPVLTGHGDFISVIESLGGGSMAKCIRNFATEDIESIKNHLENKFGAVEKHVVSSREAQHLLLVLPHVEISVSSTMIYFRAKSPFYGTDYQAVKE